MSKPSRSSIRHRNVLGAGIAVLSVLSSGALSGCGGTSCAANETDCGGTCVDTAIDAGHCGSCGSACSGATPSCSAGTCAAVAATPVYLTIVSHNEDDFARYGRYETLEGYVQMRDAILQVAALVTKHGARWDFQPDWYFLEWALVHENEPGVRDDTGGKNIVQYLHEDLGVQVDPHSHEGGGHNYADVAYLISLLGVEPSGVVGGFLYYPYENATWEKFRTPLVGQMYAQDGAVWQARALWGGGTLAHAGPDDPAYGIWRPKSELEFQVDDPQQSLSCIGNGKESSGSAVAVQGILDLLAAIESGEAPSGRMYTASFMTFELDLANNPGTGPGSAYSQYDQELSALDPYVESGRIVWATLNEVLDIWANEYSSAASRYELPQ